jgi:hemoglobin/transferrin/lactoferrin receptor protein
MAERIVVSVSKWDEEQRSVSRQITVVSAQDVRANNPQTAADLLSTTGEVYVQKSQAGGGSPRLRGFAANNVLMVVDCVRLNNAIYRSGNLQNIIQIDPNSLERTEVLFGPGSVQYGSDALGGVITFQTHQPRYSDTLVRYHGSSMLRISSATNEKTLSSDLEIQGDGLASYTAVTFSDFGDVISGGRFNPQVPDFGRRDWYVTRLNGVDTQVVNTSPLRQVYSGYSQINVLERLRANISESWNMNALLMFTTSSNIPRYDRLVELRTQNDVSRPRSAEWYYGPQLLSLNAITLNGTNVSSWADDIAITASYQWCKESRHSRPFQSDWLRNQQERVSILSLNVDTRLRIGNPEYDRDVYYGIEVSHQDVTSTAHESNIVTTIARPAVTRYPDGGSTYDTYAAYGMLRWGFTESLSISAGIRATSIALGSAFSDTTLFRVPFTNIEMRPSALTGSIGATWLPAERLAVHANVASGFRAPNVDDAAKVFDSEPGRIVVPNPLLGPVYVTTAEAGIELEFAEDWTFTTNAYRSWLQDAMEQRPFRLNGQDTIEFNGVPSEVTALQNVGRGKIEGVSVSIRGDVTPKLSFTATTTYTYGRDLTNDVPLEHVVPAFGMVSLSWKASRELVLSAQAEWSAAWLEPDISPADRPLVNINFPPGGLPAWAVAHVRAAYSPLPWLTMQGAIENMFDLQYRTAGSGISAPGRNIRFTLRTTW